MQEISVDQCSRTPPSSVPTQESLVLPTDFPVDAVECTQQLMLILNENREKILRKWSRYPIVYDEKGTAVNLHKLLIILLTEKIDLSIISSSLSLFGITSLQLPSYFIKESYQFIQAMIVHFKQFFRKRVDYTDLGKILFIFLSQFLIYL